MNITENQSLKNFNTFGIDAKAQYFGIAKKNKEILELLQFAKEKNLNIFILNGGSNSLFISDFNGLVIKIETQGIIVEDQPDCVLVSAKAGENWHNFVQYCIENNFGGLENLSLIPGNAGTSPMQNIGAYGVEIKDHFHSLKALNIQTLEIETFNNKDCKFGYRESYFKNEGKNKYIILEVCFLLTKKDPVLNTSYGSIAEELTKNGIKNPTIKDVSDAVINIRKSKLPDPKILGNAGSFFKNPTITAEQFNSLQIIFPEIHHYLLPDGKVKIPAGWLIEQCGWKGVKKGNVGVHEKQALILVNLGNASGKDIYNLSEEIIKSVKSKFEIELQREVNLIGIV